MFVKAYLLVKKSCIRAACEIGQVSREKQGVMEKAIDFLIENPKILEDNIIVSILQGGAGTSLNMNLNEIIANQALIFMGLKPGDYHAVHPNQDVNVCQSTNDTYPTALKIAVIWKLRLLTEEVCKLQEALQKKEKEFSQIVKIGRTELQDAVPMSLGNEFGAFAEVISRDRWRLYKAEERLRVVNLGGTAIGTSLNAPRRYIFLALEYLRALSGIGVSKGENLIDLTSNQDLFLEAFSWIKLLAVNLNKIAQDLRYLSSTPVSEIHLPEMQAGSSIMPGKINPVIPEMMIQISMDVISSDLALTQVVMSGNMQLNAFLPLLAYHFLKSIENLTQGIHLFYEKCIIGIEANPKKCYENLLQSYSLLTVLSPAIGYEKVCELIREAVDKGKPLSELIREKQLLTDEQIKKMTTQQED